MKEKSYVKLCISLGISWVTMYTVMFLNVEQINDIALSQTRLYMSLLMTTPMAVTMILVMGDMYKNKRANQIIVTLSILMFVFSLVLLRTQALVTDRQYMKAMIPHHSSAILTSRHARISDPEVRALADSIIASQRREIEQMQHILDRFARQDVGMEK